MELNKYTFMWQIINFLVLVFLLQRFLYKPVVNMLAKREEQIHEQMNQATEAKQASEQLRQEGHTFLEQAQDKANGIIQQATKSSELIKDDMVKEAEERTRRMISEAEARLRRDQEKAREELRRETAALAVTVTAKLLPKVLDEQAQRQLLDAAIQEVANHG